MDLKKITRRTFIIGSTALAGGFAVGYWKYKSPHDNPLLDQINDNEKVFNPYIIINSDGITIITPRAEMGQGIHTTLAALVAEELDIHLDQVRVMHGPASKAYYNQVLLDEGAPFPLYDHSWKAETARDALGVMAKFLSMQITGGSTSVPDAYIKMRKAGAAARLMLLSAAEKKYGFKQSSLKTSNGSIILPDGEKVAYTALYALIDTDDVPNDPPLKDPKLWTLLGKSQMRVDMQDKCTGKAKFAIDVTLPDMLYGCVQMNPYLEQPINSLEATKAKTMPGVEKVIELSQGGVAVLAKNTWQALNAAKALKPAWATAPYPKNTQDHFNAVQQGFLQKPDSQNRDVGDVDAQFKDKPATVQSEYQVPYLAHATMEPVNATALYKSEGYLEIWAGTQAPTQVVKEAEKITHLSADKIKVNTTYMGGGFGRRSETDFIKVAIETAYKTPDVPVKLTWSREEDMRHDFYRPLAMAKFKALIEDNKLHAFKLDLSAPSIIDSQSKRLGMSIPGPDVSIVQSAWDQPYDIPHHQVNGYRVDGLLPISYWRSVGASQNAFFHECAMDEIAYAMKKDPIDLRLNLIKHEESLKVIEAVKLRSGWSDQASNKNIYHGFAYCISFGVPVAQVIEIEKVEEAFKLNHVYVAADVGVALDPRNIEAQLQSGIIFGLSAAMMGEVTVKDHKVEQSNFHDYDALRIYQTPQIHTDILQNGKEIRGIGEPGLPPIAPALTNALFKATGQRIRQLPLNKKVRFI